LTKEEIISVLADLYKITGFRISLHGSDYAEIAAYPPSKCDLCRLIHERGEEYERCVESDHRASIEAIEKRDAYIYKCRYGMTEAVSPLYNFGTLTGFLMMGQVYSKDESPRVHAERLIGMGYAPDKVLDAISHIPVTDADIIPSYVKIMTICAQYLTVSHAVPSNRPSVAHLAKEYISLHFGSKISISKICQEIGCSKTALISAFKREYGTTVNAYLNEVRLLEALFMLKQGEKLIGEISDACGFSDQSYFSKVFSARFGVPPSEWQKVDTPPTLPY
jgi:AraC-like DNA-binding protein